MPHVDTLQVRGKKLGLIAGADLRKAGAIDLDKYADTSVVVPTSLARPSDALNYQYGMLDNDTYGDCVPASMYHVQETFALKRGTTPRPWSAATCLGEYFNINGVPPGPAGSSSDQGTDPATAMTYWQKNGLPGHDLIGFGVLDANSPNVRRAIWEFGAVMFAVLLPITAEGQGVTWVYEGRDTGNGAPGSWGGHAICGDSFDADRLGFISWGQKGTLTNGWWTVYAEQILVPLSHDQLNSAEVGPGGFQFAQMQTDLPALS
jgi:hypothetical protein